MTPERTRAYSRVMSTLDLMGPAKLQPGELEAIRWAADELVLQAEPNEGPFLLVQGIVQGLIDCERWLPVTANRLLEDLAECGPAMAVQ